MSEKMASQLLGERKTVPFFLMIVLLCLCLGATQSDKSYLAEQYDVSITVQEGGSLMVKETVIFRFSGGSFTYVFREIETNYTDGVTDIVAILDGVPLPQGTKAGQVEIKGRDPVRITWHFEETWNQARTFELSYRMLGVIRDDPTSDLLWFRPLPAEHEYTINQCDIIITYPKNISLSNQASILEGVGNIESGPGEVVVKARHIGPNQSLLINVPFENNSLVSDPPGWQARRQGEIERREKLDRLGPLWLSMAGLIVLAGIGLLLSKVRPHRLPHFKKTARTFEPPSNHSPGIAGALRSSAAKASWSHALGTLFDLASRDLLSISELPKRGRFSTRDFEIRLNKVPSDLRLHERGLLDLLFRTKSGDLAGSVKLSRLSRIVTGSRWKLYSRRLEDELEELGMISPIRKRAYRNQLYIAFGLMALFFVTSILFAIFYRQLGWWPVSIPAALLLLCIIWIVGATSISQLSDKAAALASQWDPFYQYLRDVSRGKASVSSPDMLETLLPFAAAFGLLDAWAKRFMKLGITEVPPYFNALSKADSKAAMGAFVAMTSTTSASGGTAAGAGVAGASAGAGAAGGGASGAG